GCLPSCSCASLAAQETMPQNCLHLSSKKTLGWTAVWKSTSLAFFTTRPLLIRGIARGIFSKRPHSLSYNFSVALALLLAAVLVRLFVDPIVSGRLPFITFFPALVAAAVLCHRWITIGFVIAS